jgi:hypothetical protein
MKTKACILESGDNAGDIYEYVMLAVAHANTSHPDIYSLMLSAWECLSLTDEQADIITNHFVPADYRTAQEFYCAMAALPRS